MKKALLLYINVPEKQKIFDVKKQLKPCDRGMLKLDIKKGDEKLGSWTYAGSFISAGVQQECKAKNKINNYYSCSYLTVTFSHSQYSCTVNLHQHRCWKIKPTLRVWVTHRSLDPR